MIKKIHNSPKFFVGYCDETFEQAVKRTGENYFDSEEDAVQLMNSLPRGGKVPFFIFTESLSILSYYEFESINGELRAIRNTEGAKQMNTFVSARDLLFELVTALGNQSEEGRQVSINVGTKYHRALKFLSETEGPLAFISAHKIENE